MRNDHFFPAKVSLKSQKSSKKAYFVKICCPKGAGGLWPHGPWIMDPLPGCLWDPGSARGILGFWDFGIRDPGFSGSRDSWDSGRDYARNFVITCYARN